MIPSNFCDFKSQSIKESSIFATKDAFIDTLNDGRVNNSAEFTDVPCVGIHFHIKQTAIPFCLGSWALWLPLSQFLSILILPSLAMFSFSSTSHSLLH